jgi:hypothetical protein
MLQALLLEADCPIITAHFNCCLDACHVAGIDGMFTRVPGLIKSPGVNGFCAVESKEPWYFADDVIAVFEEKECLARPFF